MAEYNWWDDRTVEDNDSMFCPVIYGNCSGEDCENCQDYKDFVEYYTKEAHNRKAHNDDNC